MLRYVFLLGVFIVSAGSVAEAGHVEDLSPCVSGVTEAELQARHLRLQRKAIQRARDEVEQVWDVDRSFSRPGSYYCDWKSGRPLWSRLVRLISPNNAMLSWEIYFDAVTEEWLFTELFDGEVYR